MSQANPDLLNYLNAARLLGYKTSAQIKKLITIGKLKEYSIPDSTRKMIDRQELEDLIKAYQIPDKNSDK